MLEMEMLECRVVYKYSPDMKIEITKINLDWAWAVRRNGELLHADVSSSESEAEHSALKYARGC